MSILRVSRRRAMELAAAGFSTFSITDAAFAQAHRQTHARQAGQ